MGNGTKRPKRPSIRLPKKLKAKTGRTLFKAATGRFIGQKEYLYQLEQARSLRENAELVRARLDEIRAGNPAHKWHRKGTRKQTRGTASIPVLKRNAPKTSLAKNERTLELTREHDLLPEPDGWYTAGPFYRYFWRWQDASTDEQLFPEELGLYAMQDVLLWFEEHYENQGKTVRAEAVIYSTSDGERHSVGTKFNRPSDVLAYTHFFKDNASAQQLLAAIDEGGVVWYELFITLTKPLPPSAWGGREVRSMNGSRTRKRAPKPAGGPAPSPVKRKRQSRRLASPSPKRRSVDKASPARRGAKRPTPAKPLPPKGRKRKPTRGTRR